MVAIWDGLRVTGDAGPRPLGDRAFRWGVIGLLATHLLMLVLLARVTPWTIDEPNYLAAGVAIRKHFEFEAFNTILHGPIPFLANQALAWAVPTEPWQDYKLFGRLGLVPFSILAGLLLTGLARQAFGRRVALAALVLWCLDPIVLGHGCLMTADMTLTCAYLGTVFAAWGWFRAPSAGRLALVGLALGLSLATKFLALFLIPALGLTALIACLRGLRPALLWSRRAGAGPVARVLDLLPAALGCGLVALLTLHSCYLWRAKGYVVRAPRPAANVDPQDPAAGPLSDAMRAAIKVPGVPSLLHLLPAPFVRGVDYQKFYSEKGGVSHFMGRIGPGFAGYFVTALAVKLPLAFLLLLLLGLTVRAPPWPTRLGGLVFWSVLVPLAYLSLRTSLQIGVRYLLPILPLLCLVAARPCARLWDGSLLGRVLPFGMTLGRVLLGLLAVAFVGCHLLTWPRYIGSFNSLANKRPYLLFWDSNLYWHARFLPDADLEAIQRRHPESRRVFAQSGPRFGTLLIHAQDLGAADPMDPTREYHWLRRFVPIDRLGAFFVFRVDAAAYRAAIGAGGKHPDPRGMVELAIALLGSGQATDALATLGRARTSAPALEHAARLQLAGTTQDPAYAQALSALGRHDLVLAPGQAAPVGLRALAYFRRGQLRDARRILEQEQRAKTLPLGEALILASCLQGLAEPEAAIAVLERYASAGSPEQRAMLAKILRKLREETRAMRLLQRKKGGG